MGETVLAVDPGRQKCGLAVGRPGVVLARAVLPVLLVPETVSQWVSAFGVTRLVIGGGTGSAALRRTLGTLPGIPPIEVVGERETTLEARRRYFRDHPPAGWRRLLPLSLQVPPTDYDDYVAELLLERALGKGADEAPK